MMFNALLLGNYSEIAENEPIHFQLIIVNVVKSYTLLVLKSLFIKVFNAFFNRKI